MIRNKLSEIGVDLEQVLRRIGIKEDLYLQICEKFLQDSNYQLFMEALKRDDNKCALFHIHALKGVAANMGFVNLEHYCGNLITRLRQDNSYDKTDVINLTAAYEKIIEVIKDIIEHPIS